MSTSDAESLPELRRKKEPSMTPSAIRGRRFRRRRRERVQFVAVPFELNERDIDELEAAGHLDARIESKDPKAAYRRALKTLLDLRRACKAK